MIQASDEIYILMGKIGMGMERIHHQLATLVSSISARHARYSELQQALTAVISLRQITDLCEMLYLSLSQSDEGKHEFKELIKQVRDLEQKRNGIVHSVWMPIGDGEFAKWKFARDKRSGIRFSGENFNVGEFESVATECGNLEKKLIFFVYTDFKRGGSPFHVHEIT